jgi:hypothetical protein
LVLPVRHLDDDAATGDPIEEPLEPLETLLDSLLDGLGAGQTDEGDLRGDSCRRHRDPL